MSVGFCFCRKLAAPLDGIDMWSALRDDTESPRTEILHNIDDIYGNAALTVHEWKVLKGTNYNGDWDSWYGPAGDRTFETYNVTKLMDCPAAIEIRRLGRMPDVETIQ